MTTPQLTPAEKVKKYVTAKYDNADCSGSVTFEQLTGGKPVVPDFFIVTSSRPKSSFAKSLGSGNSEDEAWIDAAEKISLNQDVDEFDNMTEKQRIKSYLKKNKKT